MRLFTEIDIPTLPVQLTYGDSIMVLGSCFSDNIGTKLSDAGFDVCVNPFGTLYNPASVADALERLECGSGFTAEDCVEMGAGAGLICSFSHHTSFARADKADFLRNANAALAEASGFWHGCNKVIITFGTAFVWRRADSGRVVANCLKRPSSEFSRTMLSDGDVSETVRRISALCGGRDIIFTVSPIRHLGQGAHLNTLSKAALQLGTDNALKSCRGCYFPSYEIVLDELRDYRFFADDLCHPSPAAIEIIWEKLLRSAIPEDLWPEIAGNIKTARQKTHRRILNK